MDGPAKAHLDRLLASREWPKTICPSEVARAMSSKELAEAEVSSWRDLMPRIREHVFKLRNQGQLEVLQKGQILGQEIDAHNVTGPIRVRQKADTTDSI